MVTAIRSSDIVGGGLTYRKLDHWVRKGYITPLHEVHGAGNKRSFSRRESGVARRMQELIEVGFTLEAAAKYARCRDTEVELTSFATLRIGTPG